MTAVPRHPFACIVLAAGAGTRFGGPKSEARLASGERFLDVVVGLASECGASPVVAVVPPGTRNVADGVRVVHNANAIAEQIASLRLGLAELDGEGAEGVLVWPVDHPLVKVESALAVVDAFRRTHAAVVVPTFGGRRGHPGFFARETWVELMTIDQGGAREVIARYASRVAAVPVDDAGILRDIDTRADIPHDDGWRTTDALS